MTFQHHQPLPRRSLTGLISPEDVTRRTFISGALASALLIACGSDDDSEDAASGSGGFPRSVTHKMGSAAIPSQPVRVAAVSDGEALDHLLALGIQPVIYGQTPGYDGKGILGPWTSSAIQGTLNAYQASRGEPDIERFAAASPDLIVGAWTTEDQYSLLQGIAPTIVIKVQDGTAWPEMQRLVGEATGREKEAEDALAETDRAIEAAAQKLRPYAGRRVTIGYKFFDELFMHGADTPIARLVVRLGLDVQGPSGSPDTELATFSLEQMNRYQDADIMLSPWFFPDDQQAMESSPLFLSLPAVRDGRYMPLSLDIAQAGYTESTLSVRWVVPRLADAIVQAAEGRGKVF